MTAATFFANELFFPIFPQGSSTAFVFGFIVAYGCFLLFSHCPLLSFLSVRLGRVRISFVFPKDSSISSVSFIEIRVRGVSSSFFFFFEE